MAEREGQASAAPPADDVLVSIQNVRKTFGDTVALDDVSLDVRKKEMFALLGASGSGKTTLLRLLAGFDRPDAGRILIDGKDMTAVPPYERPVNLMFQSYALFPHMTVGANVAFGLRQERGPGKPDAAEIERRTKETLELVRLDGFERRRPHQLSGGQQQRVALARALVKRPRLLLLDEPLAALDRKLREHTQNELVRIQDATGITFIIVTHDQEEAMSLSDRLAVLNRGRIAQLGPPRHIYEFPATAFVADFIGSVNVFDAEVASIESNTVKFDSPEAGCVLSVADAPRTLHKGAKVHVILRPERIKIELDETERTSETNQVLGVVRNMAFLGNQARVVAELPGGKLVTAVRLNPGEEADTCQIGTKVRMSWSPQDCRGLVE